MRRVKLPQEVQLIEAACDVASRSVQAVIATAADGMSDVEAATLATKVAYDCGVEWVSHAAVVAQARAREANWLPRGRRLGDGEGSFSTSASTVPAGIAAISVARFTSVSPQKP